MRLALLFRTDAIKMILKTQCKMQLKIPIKLNTFGLVSLSDEQKTREMLCGRSVLSFVAVKLYSIVN